MQNTDSLSRAIHAARAGQPTLARFHCQQAAEMQSDDPLVWLWLAWLSDSPSSMYQCLQVAQKDARYSEIAEAGIVFARALCGIETDCDGSRGEGSSPSDVAASPLRISDAHEVGDTHEVGDADVPLPPETDLFAVAQAMLGESQDNGETVDGLAAGVMVTSDPWIVRSVTAASEIDNTEIQEEPAADEITTEETVDVARPAWAEDLGSCDDQSEWSAQDDEFIPVAESASAVEKEALAAEGDRADDRVENNRTGAATGRPSAVVNFGQEAGIDEGAEQYRGVDDNRGIPTVLVVDDSPAVRKLVQMTLRGRGYNIVTAFDGVAAIKEIARHEPWLILLDINMPRLDGYQLCSLIRKHERTRHIPVVLLSGNDGVFDPTRGKMVGCTSYIVKPFVPEALIEEVEKHIGEHAGAVL